MLGWNHQFVFGCHVLNEFGEGWRRREGRKRKGVRRVLMRRRGEGVARRGGASG